MSGEPPLVKRVLCGKPYVLSEDENGEQDTLYCGLHPAHAGPFHVALLWWTEDAAIETERITPR